MNIIMLNDNFVVTSAFPIWVLAYLSQQLYLSKYCSLAAVLKGYTRHIFAIWFFKSYKGTIKSGKTFLFHIKSFFRPWHIQMIQISKHEIGNTFYG